VLDRQGAPCRERGRCFRTEAAVKSRILLPADVLGDGFAIILAAGVVDADPAPHAVKRVHDDLRGMAT
jgi:hypothetical protein